MSAHRQVRQRVIYLGLASLAAVVVIALGFSAITVLAARNASLHRFSVSDASITNPGRGWQDPIADIGANPDAVSHVPANETLARTFVRLDEYRTTALPKSLLNNISKGLDNAHKQRVSVIIRFVYNDGPSTGSQDASAAMILDHIAQLAPVLKAHKNALAAVEAGFIGAWGEWHGSSNGLDTNAWAKRQIVAALGSAIPAPVPILLRYPYDIRDLQTTWRNTATLKPILARIGSHQDCFLASDPDDWGTWGQRGGNVSTDKKLIAGLTHAFVGGETCNPSPPARTNCTTALSEMKLMHFTYLNRRFEENSLARLSGCNKTITDKLGYRFVITEGNWPRNIKRASKHVKISIKFSNTGFAAPTMQQKLNIVLIRGKTRIVKTLSSDIRVLKPGKHTLKATVKLPKTMPRGRYTIYLESLPAGANSLTATGKTAKRNLGIQFANAKVWTSKLQANRLGTIRIK